MRQVLLLHLLHLLAVNAATTDDKLSTTTKSHAAATRTVTKDKVQKSTPNPVSTSLTGISPFHYVASATAEAPKKSQPACTPVQHTFPSGEGGDPTRAAAVASAYREAWEGFQKYAPGQDELQPLSQEGVDNWFGWGVDAVDGIDTAIIMNLTDIVEMQLDIIEKIDFTTTSLGAVEIFDVNIRYVGGLLSAYDLLKSGEFYNDYPKHKIDSLLKQATSLADKIAYGFNTATGIQSSNVNFTTNTPVFSTFKVNDQVHNATNTASLGTFVLEWFRLSDLTGNSTYRHLAARAQSWAINTYPAPVYPGLVGTQFDVDTGEMLVFDGGWHSEVDSFLEYLIKTYQYDRSVTSIQYKDFWLNAVQSTAEHLAVKPAGHPEITFLSGLDTNGTLNYFSDSYANFAGGNMILGGILLDMPEITELGMAITDGHHVMYNATTTKLGPMGWQWFNEQNQGYTKQDDNDMIAHRSVDDRGFWIPEGGAAWGITPELIESVFYAFRTTGDAKWADYNWETFQAMQKTSKVAAGYAVVDNVDMPYGGSMSDSEDSFLFAEVLKYLYLTFTDPSVVDLGRWVFNTECHPLRAQCQ